MALQDATTPRNNLGGGSSRCLAARELLLSRCAQQLHSQNGSGRRLRIPRTAGVVSGALKDRPLKKTGPDAIAARIWPLATAPPAWPRLYSEGIGNPPWSAWDDAAAVIWPWRTMTACRNTTRDKSRRTIFMAILRVGGGRKTRM